MVMDKYIKPVLSFMLKVATKILKWLKDAIVESIAQIFTLLGFFIAWLTLTGTAQQVVGIATVASTAIWLLTIPLRQDKE